MSFTKSLHIGVTLGLWVIGASLPACGHGQPETPVEERRHREVAWISGQITGVDRIPIGEYNESTVHLIITTEGEENVRVKLGPGWYMEEEGLTFAPHQHIEFRGQPDPADGSYVAQSVRRGVQTLELRNADGSPRWPSKQAPGGNTSPSATAPTTTNANGNLSAPE
jgi:hypothetical protein